MSRALQRMIHVGCRELGIDADTRHDLQFQITGKQSLTDMDDAELKLIVDALKAKGFVSRRSTGPKHKRAARADIRLIHVLWKALGDAGALRDPSRDGLNRFIRKRFGAAWGSVPADVDMLREWAEIDGVIQALKQWVDREEIDFDWGEVRR